MTSLLVGAALLVSGCARLARPIDISQERLDAATPPIRGLHTAGQTFVARHPNLSAIELLLVVHDGPGRATDGPRLTFHLRRSPQSQEDIVSLDINAGRLRHNDPLRLSFAPQPDSEGRVYYFFLEGSQDSRIGVWYNSLNAYGQGTMYLDGRPAEGDLRFVTYYDYDLGLLAGDMVQGLAEGWWLALPLAALLVLPGYLLLSFLLPEPNPDPVGRLALAFGLSLALVPLVLLWTTALGLRLSPPLAVGPAVALAIVALWRLATTGWRGPREWFAPHNRLLTGALAFLLGLTIALRFLQARDLALPPWVDSVHHTLIAQLIADGGRVPASYRPFLPLDGFHYHYGFHALSAALVWLSGLATHRAVLIMGQVLNAGAALSAYLLAAHLTRRRLAGLFGLLIVGTISAMPAYYLSWGRYTQLAGMALLPSAIVLTVDGLEKEERKYRRLALAGIAVGGLALTHYRVLIFYGCFLAAYLLYETCARRSESGERWLRAAILCLLAALLILPWLVNLAGTLSPLAALPSWLRGSASYNAVPRGFLRVGHSRELIALALAGALWGLRGRERGATLTLLWVATMFLAVNPSLLGLPTTWLVNNASVIIALFLPLAVLGGYFLASLSDGLRTRWRFAHRFVLGSLMVAAALWGSLDMFSIVNPVTVLATPDDVAAMEWIRGNVPKGAKFLINVRHWQEGIYVGTDGGYWIPLLAGRETTLPPAIYGFGSPEYIAWVNNLARVVAGPNLDLDDEGVLQLLRGRGVTHVYIGARGGNIRPQMLVDSPHWHLVYSNGAVWIFELAEGT